MSSGQLGRVISVINGKGGVGKTTLTANLAGLLAANGWQVLAVDLDHQGNLGLDLGYAKGEHDDRGEALSASLNYPDRFPLTPIKNIRPNLDVIVGGPEIELASRNLAAGSDAAKTSLARALSGIVGNYDVVLLDCPPGNEAIQINAVVASRYLLIPAKADEGSLDGLERTASRVYEASKFNPHIDLLGVVVFDADSKATRVREAIMNKVAKALGIKVDSPEVFKAFVRHSSATAMAARERGMLVHELDEAVRAEPKWYERLRSGDTSSSGPKTARGVADDLQAIAATVIDRIQEMEGANV